MRDKEILRVAVNQSSLDANCNPEDFFKCENVVVNSARNPKAKKHLSLPSYCTFVSYGNNVIASVNPEFAHVARNYINKYPIEHCFETPSMYVINDELQKRNMQICFMSEYFLPDMDLLAEKRCSYELKTLGPADFQGLYTPEWSNALSEKHEQLDVLAVGAFSRDRLIGLAGCSAECETMWQIGVDVLADFRRQGVAAALTSKLAIETLKRGKVPYYCSAWSNIGSVRTAMKSGFRPAWVEMTAEPIEFVSEMNR